MIWYYAKGNEKIGPYSELDFEKLIRAGIVDLNTLVWRKGMAGWQPLSKIAKNIPAVTKPISSQVVKPVMKKSEDLNKGELIKADLYSRPNYMNGKYKAGQLFGLNNLREINNNDIFFLETLKVRADSADKIIDEAEMQGKDTNDPNVMKELGEKINALGKPIHRSESVLTAVFVSMQLMACYGIAIGIWGFVFKKSFLIFGIYGVIVGVLISLLSVAPVIAFQRTKERIGNMVFGASSLWGNLGIIIGVVGLVAWVIRLIFF